MVEEEKPDLQLPEPVRGWASIFPYAMVLFSFFMNGVVFCSIDIPLLWISATNSKHALSLTDLLRQAKVHLLVASQGMGGSAAFLCGLLALAVGVFLQSFLQPPFFMLNWPVSAARRRFRVVNRLLSFADKTRPLFYKPAFSDAGCDYALFAEWFQYHKHEKFAWEWELFNYYLSLGGAFNLSVASLAVWYAANSSVALTGTLLFVWLVSCFNAGARSIVQEKMFTHYLRRVSKDKNQG